MPFITYGEARAAGMAGLEDVASDFERWSSILDQYTDIIPFIDSGSARESLAHKANQLYPVQQSLKRAFQGSPGANDLARAAAFDVHVKSFRGSVNKARDQYGTLPTAQPVYLLKNAKGAKKGMAKAGFGFKWWYLLLLLPFAGKLTKH